MGINKYRDFCDNKYVLCTDSRKKKKKKKKLYTESVKTKKS